MVKMMEAPFKTHGELIRALILLYQNAMDEAPEDSNEMWEFLKDKFLTNGICLAAKFTFNLFIYRSKFVNAFTDGRYYYCHTPEMFQGDSEAMIESLKARVNRLQDMLLEWDEVEMIVYYKDKETDEYSIE